MTAHLPLAPLPASSPCRDCWAGCCRAFTAEIFGSDAVRIGQVLGVPLHEFVELLWSDQPDLQHRIILDGPERQLQYCRLVLSRTRSAQPEGPLPLRCVFLLEIGELGRCGIHAHRPLVCRAYPYRIEDDALAVNSSPAFCPENSWRLDQVGDGAAVLAFLRFKRRQAGIHHSLIDVWNRREGGRTKPRFYAFLVEAYRAIEERHREWLDEKSADETPIEELRAAVEALISATDPAAR